MKRLPSHFRRPNWAAPNACLFAVTAAVRADSTQSGKQPAGDQQKKPEEPLPTVPLQLADGAKPEISYTWRELESDRALISIWNSSKEQQKITATVTDFDLSAGSIGRGAFSIHLKVSPDSTASPRYGVTRFTLTLQDAATVPAVRGSYSGVLLLAGEG